MIYLFTIPLILAFICFYAGGYLRGLFECVLLFDSVDDWRGPYWAFDAFTKSKDRNKDGKTTFWELTFPDDGGHRSKLYELIWYANGSALFGIAAYLASSLIMQLDIVFLVLLSGVQVALTWWVISLGFLTSFKKYRKSKQSIF